ncbi:MULTISPECIES: isocitrate lyase/PEP mutase family protein [unclassified Pseudomonas]|uniref:isocitrate lyase/PEP mutase family protein n=1 Tax=unclassified Pseudomonas TaxID=196821 RepID=UPI00384A5D79
MNASKRFNDLHRPGSPMFVMPNAWDEGSARLIEQLEYPSLGTTSAGIAYAHGYSDSSVTMDNQLRFEAIDRIVRAVRIPVSADLENGLAKSSEGVENNFRQISDMGCGGASIEDIADYSAASGPVFFDVERARERVVAACEAVRTRNPHFVVTARTDYLLGPHEYSLSEVIKRLTAFEAAGADCLFAPGLRSMEDLLTVQNELSKPINVLPAKRMTLDRLRTAGVQRVSLGSSLFRAAYKQIAMVLAELDQVTGMDYMQRALPPGHLEKIMR